VTEQLNAPRGTGPPYRAVVVDDEPAAREAVRTFLAGLPAVEVVGEAATAEQAVETVRAQSPDLLFLDVQMPDRDGFAVLAELGSDVPAGVVLVTAHDEYAQRAFEVHAVDYVMKPFGRPRFLEAAERALRRLEAEEALSMRETLRSLVRSVRGESDATAAVLETSAERTSATRARLGVRVGSRTTLVELGEIDWIEADRDLVRVHVGDRVHLVSGRMRDFEEVLDPKRFLRVHRSAIVNLDRVTVLDRDRDGGGSVVLTSGLQLRVARGRWDDLERALGLRLKG
jgi:two-component system LytT family response regulator